LSSKTKQSSPIEVKDKRVIILLSKMVYNYTSHLVKINLVAWMKNKVAAWSYNKTLIPNQSLSKKDRMRSLKSRAISWSMLETILETNLAYVSFRSTSLKWCRLTILKILHRIRIKTKYRCYLRHRWKLSQIVVKKMHLPPAISKSSWKRHKTK